MSTQKNPNMASSTHLIPMQPANINCDIQIPSAISSLSETNTFYAKSFSGFSVPPPPFPSQPQQRCLKEIATESTTPHRSVLNEVQIVQSSTSSTNDEIKSIKTVQSTDLTNNGNHFITVVSVTYSMIF